MDLVSYSTGKAMQNGEITERDHCNQKIQWFDIHFTSKSLFFSLSQ